MKKQLFPLILAATLLAGCAETGTCVCSSNEQKVTSSAIAGEVETGATDTGVGGLNFGDVDWSEDLKKEAVATYLSGIGGNHREMMQIATVSAGKPQIASVEYYLDVATNWFFGSSETGTGKVMDMKKDGNVALYWTRQLRAEDMTMAPNYFVSYGVEVQGKAIFYTVDQVNALEASEKSKVITIARGYYQSMGAQYKKYYDATAEGYMDDATFVSTVFGSPATTPYIIKPSKIVITSPYLLFVARVEDASKDGGYYYAFQQGQMTLSEFAFLPKAFLDKLLKSVRDGKNDQTLTKFTSMKADYSGATGLKTQVTLKF